MPGSTSPAWSSPGRLVAIHHLSERSLYKLLHQSGISLEQRVISQRPRARGRTWPHQAQRRTIAAIVHR